MENNPLHQSSERRDDRVGRWLRLSAGSAPSENKAHPHSYEETIQPTFSVSYSS